MNSDHWMPLYIGDYLRDTMHLTAAQHGGYLLVLMAMWSCPSGRLPLDDEMLRTITRMTPEEWQKNRLVIMQFLTVEGTQIYQKRLVAEKLRCEDIQAKRMASGRLGGRPRKPFGLEPQKNQTVKQNESKTKVTTTTTTVHNHSTQPKAQELSLSAPPDTVNGDRRHSEFVRGWCLKFQAVHRVPYAFSGGKDGQQLKNFLDKVDLPTAALLSMAEKAWGLKNDFLRDNSATIAGFCTQYNKIVSAIKSSSVL